MIDHMALESWHCGPNIDVFCIRVNGKRSLTFSKQWVAFNSSLEELVSENQRGLDMSVGHASSGL